MASRLITEFRKHVKGSISGLIYVNYPGIYLQELNETTKHFSIASFFFKPRSVECKAALQNSFHSDIRFVWNDNV